MRTINTCGYILGAVLLALTAVTHAEPAAELVVDASVRKVVWQVDFGEPRRLSALIQNVNNMVTTYQMNSKNMMCASYSSPAVSAF